MERAKTKCGYLKVVQCHVEQRLKGQKKTSVSRTLFWSDFSKDLLPPWKVNQHLVNYLIQMCLLPQWILNSLSYLIHLCISRVPRAMSCSISTRGRVSGRADRENAISMSSTQCTPFCSNTVNPENKAESPASPKRVIERPIFKKTVTEKYKD